MESDNTEETIVEQQEATTTALTDPQYTKNKTDAVSVTERSEEVNVQRQKLKATTLETHDTTSSRQNRGKVSFSELFYVYVFLMSFSVCSIKVPDKPAW